MKNYCSVIWIANEKALVKPKGEYAIPRYDKA